MAERPARREVVASLLDYASVSIRMEYSQFDAGVWRVSSGISPNPKSLYEALAKADPRGGSDFRSMR